MWKKFATDYLTFSKKDRTGVFVLMSLVAITLSAPLVFPYLKKKKEPNVDQTKETIRQINMIFSDSSSNYKNPEKENNLIASEAPVLFYFDPNSASIEQWQKLGVRKYVATTIHKYVSKGGKFRKPEDLRKIYTLSSKDVERLLPYVRINESETTIPQIKRKGKFNEMATYQNSFPSQKQYTSVDINAADTTAFISLPGIGSKLANRIVNFRQKLGGFISIEQVGETRFLPDSTFQKIKTLLILNSDVIKKIDINHAGIDELKAHPYIQYNVANAIVQYRTQNGSFKNVGDLRKIHIIDEILFNKIQPYLSIK